MDPMNMAVFAGAILKQMNASPSEGCRPAERFEAASPFGLRDVLRVATALGAVVAYAGFLALGAR